MRTGPIISATLVRRTTTRVAAALLLGMLMPALPMPRPAAGLALAQQPMTPTLLRRLAEAVDTRRTGDSVWVVADYNFPNTTFGVHNSRSGAVADSTFRSTMEHPGVSIGLFGPFVAPRDLRENFHSLTPPFATTDTLTPIRFPARCVHIGSVMQPRLCPPDGPIIVPPIEPIPPEEGPWLISLVYESPAGEMSTYPVPVEADAIFFTLSAFDKFVIPYYVRVVGIEEAMRMRLKLLASMP